MTQRRSVELMSSSCVLCEPGRYQDQADSSAECKLCPRGRFFDMEAFHSAPAIPAQVITELNAGPDIAIATTENPQAKGFRVDDTVQITDNGATTCAALAAAGPQRYTVVAVTSSTLTISGIDPGLVPATDESDDVDLRNPCSVERLSIQTSIQRACPRCEPGRFSPEGSTTCFNCSPGRADLDEDPATECDVCEEGTYANPLTPTDCTICAAGQVDEDQDATVRTTCPQHMLSSCV